jgi:hypothetical protein
MHTLPDSSDRAICKYVAYESMSKVDVVLSDRRTCTHLPNATLVHIG